MFKPGKSILHLCFGLKISFSPISNLYAEPQKIITITGKDKEALILEIQKNAKALISGFKTADLLTVQRSIYKNYWDPTKMETFTKNGYSMKIPKTFSKVDDTGDFVWYRMRLDGGNSMELFSYTVPIQSIDDENGNNLVAIRDTIGKRHIPGQIEGSYMITEAAYTPHIFEVKIDGKKALEAKGKWEVKGVYMAGPFLSYSIIDKAKNRLVVGEGLTYAPSMNKRDYMFELEAIMKTIKIY